MSMVAPPRQRAQGFVLVTVLAMLVILTILAATIGVMVQRLRDDQLARQRQFQAQVAMASTKAGVAYLLTSQRTTFGGITVDERMVLSLDERLDSDPNQISYMPVGNEVALDGRAYLGIPGAEFALQDDRGLLAVNWTSPVLLENFLGGGKRAGLPMVTLQSLLLDYQDPDDLYRLNSAERDEYLKQGRPPPSNRTLLTPLQLRRVKGWDAALAGMDDAAVSDALTMTRNAQININTAPLAVLRSLPGMDAAMAAQAVAARTLQPFLSLTAFYQLVGAIPGDSDLLSLYPAQSGTLKIWSPDGGAVDLLHWTVTPFDDGGKPWREDYEFTLPRTDQTAGPAGATAATVFAEPVPAQP